MEPPQKKHKTGGGDDEKHAVPRAVTRSGMATGDARTGAAYAKWHFNLTTKVLTIMVHTHRFPGQITMRPMKRSKWQSLPDEVEDLVGEFLGDYGEFYLAPLTGSTDVYEATYRGPTSTNELRPYSWHPREYDGPKPPAIKRATMDRGGNVVINDLRNMPFWCHFAVPVEVARFMFP